MLRSLYSGLSGLRASQLALDIIGNNVANVNTVGYKSSRAMFKEVMQQTIRSATAASTSGPGGLNPMQVGLGTNIGSIDSNLNQGFIQVTNRETDFAIEGSGYFILSDGANRYYTRAGNFDIDRDGGLVYAANGYRVQGVMAVDGGIPSSGALTDLTLPFDTVSPPAATTSITYAGNLDRTADEAKAEINIYDAAGNSTNLSLTFTNNFDNTWDMSLSVNDGSVAFAAGATTTVTFDPDTGLLVSPETTDIVFTPTGASALTMTLNLGTAGGSDGLTEFGSKANSVRSTARDGYTGGELRSFIVDESGIFTGIFSNGQQETIGQIYIGAFNNPAGLIDRGGNMFIESPNSGPVAVGPPGVGPNGQMNQGALEMSNVDLAEEFTNLITTQRGYQANARVITTSQEILAELLNLMR